MRTASLLAVAVAMATELKNRSALTQVTATGDPPQPYRNSVSKTERRAATKRAKQARKQQRGKK